MHYTCTYAHSLYYLPYIIRNCMKDKKLQVFSKNVKEYWNDSAKTIYRCRDGGMLEKQGIKTQHKQLNPYIFLYVTSLLDYALRLLGKNHVWEKNRRDGVFCVVFEFLSFLHTRHPYT